MAQHLGERDERMSAFIDGELEAAVAARILADCRQHSRLMDDWAAYHCIGDVLRSDEMGCHSSRLSAAIASRLEAEPFLMAPVASAPVDGLGWRRPASYAAAAAAVIAVGLVALPQSLQRSDQVAAAVAPVAVPVPILPLPGVSSEYIAAHRQYARSVGVQAAIGQVSFSVTEPGR